mmetsp:Transcript_31193/g.40129  ORF Transcript_31193/g.40129 Transcript_31193/m.40129 type:complete len:172 (-) Transcript_31193:267-782(-)
MGLSLKQERLLFALNRQHCMATWLSFKNKQEGNTRRNGIKEGSKKTEAEMEIKGQSKKTKNIGQVFHESSLWRVSNIIQNPISFSTWWQTEDYTVPKESIVRKTNPDSSPCKPSATYSLPSQQVELDCLSQQSSNEQSPLIDNTSKDKPNQNLRRRNISLSDKKFDKVDKS